MYCVENNSLDPQSVRAAGVIELPWLLFKSDESGALAQAKLSEADPYEPAHYPVFKGALIHVMCTHGNPLLHIYGEGMVCKAHT